MEIMNIVLKHEHNDALIKNIGEKLKRYWAKETNPGEPLNSCGNKPDSSR
jgi:hypothetical protein